MMTNILKRTDPAWLDKQYASPSNLEDRVALHRVCGSDAGKWYEWVFDQMKQVIPPTEKSRLLEIGGGSGNIWIQNHHLIPPNWEIFFTDRSEGMVTAASAALSQNAQFHFSVLDASQVFPFVSGSFDIVVANHVLYHIEKLDECLGEIRRVLTDAGVLFATCTGKQHMQQLYEWLHEFEPSVPAFVSRHMNMQDGKAILEKYATSVDVIMPASQLTITEEHIPLLVRYAYSIDEVKQHVGEENKRQLHDFFIQKLQEQQGTLVIPKEEGLFIAKK